MYQLLQNLGGALATASINDEDDIINLAEGTYKTTDDGDGAFVYLEQINRHKLILQGSSSILDGDGVSQVFTATRGGTLTVNNITFQNGSSSAYAFDDSTGSTGSTFNNCIFVNNNGGAIYSSYNLEVNNSHFEGNTSSIGGAISGYMVDVVNSKFINNTADFGSAIKTGAFVKISGSIFKTENLTSSFVYSVNSSVYAYNNLFSGEASSAVQLVSGGSADIRNSVFLSSSSLFDILGDEYTRFTVINSYLDESKIDIKIAYSGENNIYGEPLLSFVDEASGDYRLKDSSGLIDSGKNGNSDYITQVTDIDGDARLSGGAIDIGPYEFNSTRPTINSITYTGAAEEQKELTFTTSYTLSVNKNIDNISYDFMNDGNYTSLNTYTYNTAGTYTVGVKVTDSEGDFSTTTTSVIVAELPFSEMTYEQKLIKAISPEYYDLLIPEIDFEKSESFSSGKQYVQDNLAEFSLVTEAAQATAVTAATTAGITDGKQYVQDNLTEFSLVTEAAQATAVTAASTTGIVTGKQYVQDNLAEFSLVTEAAQATAVTAATTAGITDGKQYVQDNLTEFSLVTEAAQATAVTAASTTGIVTGENNVISHPVDYGLNIVVGLSKEGVAQLPSGWKMISIPEDVTDLSIFDDAKVVWFFSGETQAWTGYSSNTDTIQQMKDNNIGIITSLSAGDGVFIEM